ncbi:MAG: hypothetical protein QM783_05180 [Phycisphaerales bacterium]
MTHTLTQTRPELVVMLAGALAQSATPSLTIEEPGKPSTPLAPRTTDLPALLRTAAAGTKLRTPDGCTIALTDTGCTITNPGRHLLQAVERFGR